MRSYRGMIVSAMVLAFWQAALAAETRPVSQPSQTPAILLEDATKAAGGSLSADRRQQLAGTAAALYVASAADSSVNWAEWSGLLTVVGSSLPGPARDQIIRDLLRDMAAKEPGALDAQSMCGMSNCAIALGQNEQAATCWKGWLNARTKDSGISLNDAASAAGVLSRLGDAAKSTRGQFAARVTEAIAGGAGNAASMASWQILAKSLGKELKPESKELWLAGLRQAAGGRAMSAADVMACGGALRALGDRASGDFIAEWMRSANVWRTWFAADLAILAQEVRGKTAACREARASLVDLINRTLIAGEEASVRRAGPEVWRSLTGAIGKDVPADARVVWISRLRAAFAEPELTLGELAAVSASLRQLGDKSDGDYAAAWLKGKDWRDWSLGDKILLAGVLTGTSQAVKASRLELAQAIEGRYWKDSEAAKGVSPQQWHSLMGLLNDLPADMLSRGAETIALAYKGDGSLSVKDLGNLAVVTSTLGGTNSVGTFASGWVMTNKPTWQSWKLDDVLSIANNLSGASAACAAAKTELAAHVTKAFMSDPGGITPSQWSRLAGAFRTTSAATRQQWMDNLQGAYVSKAVSTSDLKSLVDAVNSMGGNQLKFLGQWVDRNSVAWQTWSVGDLNTLGGLANGDAQEAKSIRLATARCLMPRFVAQLESARDASALATAPGNALRELPAAERMQWLQRLRDTAAAKSMTAREVAGLVNWFAMLGDKEPGSFVAAWMMKEPSRWNAWPAEDLLVLAKQLTPPSPSTDAARNVLVAAFDRFSRGTSDAATVRPDQWLRATQELAQRLSAEQRARWLAALSSAFVDRPMSADDIANLSVTARTLGDTDGRFVSAWLSANICWQSWSAADLARLGNTLSSSPAARMVRARVGDQVMACLAQARSDSRLAPVDDLCAVLGSFHKGASVQERLAWIQRVRSMAAPNTETIAGLKQNEVLSIADGLRSMGDGNADDLVATWVLHNTAWRGMQATGLGELVEKHLRAPTETCKRSRAAIASSITATCFTGSFPSEIGEEKWGRLSQQFATDLSATDRSKWAATLMSAFAADPKRIAALPREAVRDFVNGLSSLDAKAAETVVVKWFEEHGSLDEIPIDSLYMLGHLLKTLDAEKRQLLLSRIEQTVLSHEPTATQCRKIGWMCSRIGRLGSARSWCLRAYQLSLSTEQALAAVDPETLFWIADEMFELGMVAKNVGYPEYARALAAIGRSGRLAGRMPSISGHGEHFVGVDQHHQVWATPLGTQECRDILIAAMVDDSGRPAIELGKILTWTYRRYGELGDWARYVDAHLAGARVNSDEESLWLLLKAYVDAVRPAKPNAALGFAGLRRAFAAAQTEACRLRVLKEIVACQMDNRYWPGALSLLESTKGSFGDEARQYIEKEQESLRQRIEDDDKAFTIAESREEQSHAVIQAAYLHNRLSVAEHVGDDAAVKAIREKLQALIQGLGH